MERLQRAKRTREFGTIVAHTSVIDSFTYMDERMGRYDRLARHGSDFRLFGVMGRAWKDTLVSSDSNWASDL